MPKAIVLAGGGARGSYHIGAWQALIEMGYRPDIVTGTSVGSMNATLVALDRFEDAKAMWLSLNDKDVLTLPNELSTKEVLRFARQVAIDGGLDMSPMENMIIKFLNEDELRKAKCRYGLVTVNLKTLKPLELTLEEIPHGQLVDYVMASGACFPALKMKKIGDELYIDGGYYDNVPSNLAAKMGADEIVEINLDGIGNERELEEQYKDVKITRVSSYHDLGSILTFSPELGKRNIELGYLDTYKAFGKLDGVAYGFRKGSVKKLYDKMGKGLFSSLKLIMQNYPTVALSTQIYFSKNRQPFKDKKSAFIAILEGAMLSAQLPLGEVYTCELLMQKLMQSKKDCNCEKFCDLEKTEISSYLLLPLAAAEVVKVFLGLIQQRI